MSSGSRGAGADPQGPSPSTVGATPGRYLLAVHWLAESEDTRVSTGELRRSLDVSGASVTEMVGKLDERNLLEYEKYAGVRLTDRGGKVAQRLAWRFCVVTNFFGATLDTELDDETSYEIGRTLPRDGPDCASLPTIPVSRSVRRRPRTTTGACAERDRRRDRLLRPLTGLAPAR